MKTIGRYIVRGLLGRGGMSKVYKVELPVIHKITALKLLDPDPLLVQLMGWDQLRGQFEQEAVTMAGLHHPNIVAIHDFDSHEGRPFYVMDFLASNLGALMGESGQVERQSRIIPTDQALHYIRQTITGIGCLHDAGIIHRDIKPYNLLITEHDTIKIGDFGLSKLRGEKFSGPSNLNVGSPFYAAPEQEADPDQADRCSDLYAAGVILFRMLTGHLPRMDAGGEPRASQWNSDLDEHWDRFLTKAMMPDPRRRFAEARVMLGALDRLHDHWESHKSSSCRIPQMASTSARTGPRVRPLRQTPLKARPSEARDDFGADALWRPETYAIHRLQDNGDGTVTDEANMRVWQQSGSDYSRTWQSARAYVAELNAAAFAGRNDWRLPTIAELMTLLRPPPKVGDLCLAPIFDPAQRWLWSADRCSFVCAYYVDVGLGFIGWQDFSAPLFVRAVASL